MLTNSNSGKKPSFRRGKEQRQEQQPHEPSLAAEGNVKSLDDTAFLEEAIKLVVAEKEAIKLVVTEKEAIKLVVAEEAIKLAANKKVGAVRVDVGVYDEEKKEEEESKAVAATPTSSSANSRRVSSDTMRLSSFASDANQLSSLHDLSSNASDALKDFERTLSFLGKDELDNKAFSTILKDIGYKNLEMVNGLFFDLLDEVSRVTGQDHTTISVQDLAALYSSDKYHILDQNKGSGSGHALMEYAEQLFQEVDEVGTGILTTSAAMNLITKMNGNPPTNEEVLEVMKHFDEDGNGEVDLAEFKQGILRSNKNIDLGLPKSFNYSLLHPAQATGQDFVNELEKYAKGHRAVTHHLLENIECAAYDKKETAHLILKFFSAYSKFNRGFTDRIQALIGMLNSPDEKGILKKNLIEEMGVYDEETLKECEKMGIPRESVEFVPHRQLYNDLVKTIEGKVLMSYDGYIPDEVTSELVKTRDALQGRGKIGLLTLLYFGSEVIVPLLYSSLLAGLRNSLSLTNEEAKFLLLHIDMDCDHADALRDIIINHCASMEERTEYVKCTEMLLNARVAFYDALIEFSDQNLRSKDTGDQLYDNGRCLSDFTGRPVIFDMIEPHIKGASVLDVGCGEGYVSRKLTAMGASKIVGIDISEGVIEGAKDHKDKSESEYFLAGDSTKVKQMLIEKSSETNIMLGAGFDTGVFDLSVAVFLFNYMSISSMAKTFDQVFSLLKPGGHFIFSVPHPFMANHDTQTFGFSGNTKAGSYFSQRDMSLDGHISTVDGKVLNVRMQFKTVEDYINAAIDQGFEVCSFKEARVKAKDMLGNYHEFFDSVNGLPLHLVIKVRKPTNVSKGAMLGHSNSLDLLPKKINWSRVITSHTENSIAMSLPHDVNDELVTAALRCYELGISVDKLCVGRDVDQLLGRDRSFSATKRFAKLVRQRLLHVTGGALLKGLDMSALGGVEQLDQMTECSKIAYFIMCEHIGTVDSTARGKLFDVKSAKIDAMSEKADNVLFSVSDSEAGWHTDGASKDRVYDVVGLLCVSPAMEGGKFKIANACDAFDEMKKTLPKFLMYELTRSIPRDVLENGNGKGTVGAANSLSRAEGLLAMRIRYNSYPIYEVEGDCMRFRYMRYWIETGHGKANWKIPTFLRIAMDMLDDHLDQSCCFHDALERGDMIFANNAMLAHARDQFKDGPGLPPRHKVRAWIQTQKADLIL